MGPRVRGDDASGISSSTVNTHSFAISRPDTPEVCYPTSLPSNQRAQGMPGARCARSLACKIKKAYEHSHHRFTGFTRHSLRNGFNGFLRALPGVRILGCHRHQRITVCQSPVGVTRLRQFSTSNGCQDHTTSPSALASFVRVPEFAHGVDPALLIPLPPDAAASTASRPASVTIANRPSGDGTEALYC